jgi:hypothetical protein
MECGGSVPLWILCMAGARRRAPSKHPKRRQAAALQKSNAADSFSEFQETTHQGRGIMDRPEGTNAGKLEKNLPLAR